ncbi:MAG: DEAD/DEAH box helicase [bacterium]|nr:DEAD/DEAH box helicase [bacterium]MDE0288920.1 DEAD/DEAH box helicase [bacterium]MDE0437408.1 DEAD/DEAH box helicase [bacterium]
MEGTDFRRLVERWQDSTTLGGDVVHTRLLPAREARFEDLVPPPAGALADRLAARGINRLYRHQTRAVRNIREGNHVVLVSGTASGKTLCYQIPILEQVLHDPTRTALLMYPTKALAQDQLGSLDRFTIPGLLASTYDGDLPSHQRNRVRRTANVVLTNPDMLHYGILPNHRLWESFLSRLDHVVIDEMHYLRGVFGSHSARIVHRLRRLAAHYGSNPTFVLTSATIGNPAELASHLTGLDVTLLEGDASPAGERLVVLWNPPLEDPESGVRRSPIYEASHLYVDLVRRGIRTIVFGRSRKTTELIHIESARRLGKLADRIAPYRAGYTAEDRREIERRFFSGRLLGVTATNALELGIDVGGLDAALLCTFPGTISSYRQQSGRAGRSSEASMVVLVAGEDALDQYFMRHPEELLARPPEPAVINPDNRRILDVHVSCAAHELPLALSDRHYFGEELEETARRLVLMGSLRHRHGKLHWTGRRSPAHQTSLRSSDRRSFTLYDVLSKKVIGELEWERAFSDAHEGAVYLHQGATYLIERMDLRRREILARPGGIGYYTEPYIEKDLSVIDTERSSEIGLMACHLGRVRVASHVIGFRNRFERGTGGHREIHRLDLPPVEMETQAFWFALTDSLLEAAGLESRRAPGALHAAEHTMIAMMPLFAICDRSDIGGLSTSFHPDTRGPAIFIHDGYDGGAGIAPTAYETGGELVAATLETLLQCPCSTGCPSCVQSPKCGNFNEPLSKVGAIRLLNTSLDEPANSVDRLGG